MPEKREVDNKRKYIRKRKLEKQEIIQPSKILALVKVNFKNLTQTLNMKAGLMVDTDFIK